MRAGPRAALGAAAAPPEQEPGGPGAGPRVGVGARGGMEAGWAARGALHSPGRVPYAGAQRLQGLWGRHVYIQKEELPQVEAGRLGGPLLGPGVRVQLPVHLPRC